LVNVKTLARVGLAMTCPVAFGLAAVPAAVADPPHKEPPVVEPDPSTTDGPADNLDWHGCTIVSGPQYIGGVCPGSKSEGKAVAEILGSDPVPDCWDERVSDEDLAAMDKQNVAGPDGYTYYWHRCLKGVDKKTKKLEPGGMHIETWLVPIDNGTPPKTLTANQQTLVDGVADRSNIPTPVAVVSPSDHPRVGLNVAFLNGSKGTLDVNPLGAVIHAYVDHTYIEPLGKDVAPKIDCPGNGTPAQPGQTPVAGDGLCWYKYTHSSAGQAEDAYHVRITSHWVVEISATGAPGTFERLDDFTKSAISQVPVTEVQALVIQ
jgi:hypothetical protein